MPTPCTVCFAWLNTCPFHIPAHDAQAVLSWSKGVVRALQAAKVPSQEALATLPSPPADTWRFR